MPAQGRGANLDTSRRTGAPPGVPKVNLRGLPKTFEGAPKLQAAAAGKLAPVPKGGRSDKALKLEAQQTAFNQFSYMTRRNMAGGMSPRKAMQQAAASLSGKTGEARLRGSTPAQRQLERSERTGFYKQQQQDRAKTVQENILGIPVGPKRSPLEAGSRKQELEHVPRSTGIVVPPIPGLSKVVGYAAAGEGLQKLSHVVPGVGPRHLVSEAGELAAMPFVGGVAAGKALLQAAEGNKQPADKLIKGLTEGAAGEALKGHLGKALKLAEKRPLLAAAEVGGVTSAAGRLTGAGLRAAGSTADAGGLRGAAAKAGSYVRPPVAATEDANAARRGYVEQREFSKDSGRKLVQLAADMRRKPLRDEHGNVVTRVERGREVPVLKGTPKEQVRIQKNRANFEAGTTQAVEHLEREKGRRAIAKIEGMKERVHNWVAPMRVGEALTRLTAGGTIKHIDSAKADVVKYIQRARKELKRPGAYRDTHELEQAQQHLKMLEGALTNKKINWDRAVQKGLEYGRALREGDVRLKETGVFEPHELEHGALSEYALAQMKAKWGTDNLGREGLVVAKSSAAKLRYQNTLAAEREAHREMELRKANLHKQRVGNRLEKERQVGAPNRGQDLKDSSERYERAKAAHEDAVEALEREGNPEDRKLLSVQDIEAHAIKNGRAPDTLGYVPHVVTAGRPGAYHIPLKVGQRPVSAGHARTGVVWGRGGMQMDSQILKDELISKKVKANNAEAIDRVVKSAGVVRPNGQYFTPREGLEAARRLTVDTKTPYFAVRTVPAKLDAKTQGMIKDVQDPAAMETAHHAMLNDRIVTDPGTGNQTANVVLMPAAHVQTLLDHLSSPKDTERLLQMLNGPFRMSVLPQPRWLMGNFIEPYMVRLPLSGAGINLPGSAVDFAAQRQVLRAMEHSGDPKQVRAALEIRSMQRGGMFIGRRGASVHRTWQGFSGKDAEALYAAHVVRNLPVAKQLGDLILTVPQTFFHINQLIESTAQGIALGKSVRNDVQAITGSWLKSIKLGEQALAEVSKGMVDTATQHRFMQQQYEMLGQYGGFSPGVRRLVQSALPFIPWTLNSLRFSYWTLPMHHTATFASLVRLANSVQAEWEAEHKNLPPGELKYALKGKNGGLTSLARYTPFAAPIAAKEGDFQNFTNAAFPEFSGAVEALKGKNFAGQDLAVPKTSTNKGKPSPGQKVEIAINSFLEGIIPGLATTRRLEEGGGTGYGNSTALSPKVKPLTKHGSAFERTFNPFQPVYLKKTAKGKKPKAPKLGPTGSGKLGPTGGGGLGPS